MIFDNADTSDHNRDRELGPGRAARNGRQLSGFPRPRQPRDGAWARRLLEIRAERGLDER